MSAAHLISIISVYCGSDTEATAIGKYLVENGLAACCNIYPCTSLYKWQDVLSEDAEWIANIKTMPHAVETIIDHVTAAHSYELPAILVNSEVTTKKYYDWVNDSVLKDSN